MSTKNSLIGFSLLLLLGCGKAPSLSSTQEAWNAANDPLNLEQAYERKLDLLPLQAALETQPWSDTYWPSYEGGIAARWVSGETGFDYRTHNKRQVSRLSVAKLAALSPAEKFDILNGRYNYPTVQAERSRTSPDDQHWEGICHGWAPAAIAFAEPKAVLATAADGTEVPFGSADIKALLSLYTGNYGNSAFRALGARCNYDLAAHPELASRPECRDTNAGAFHIVLTNQIALLKQGFVADVTRDQQVWNQPVHGFSSVVVSTQEPSEGAAPGTVKEAVIETQMEYTLEIYPQWDAVVGTEGQSNEIKTYKYRVELNAEGEIIGGEWLQEDRPDFLWTQEKPEFRGRFAKLAELYELSQTAEALPDPTGGN